MGGRTGFMKQIVGYGRIVSQAAQNLLTAHVLQLKKSHDVADWRNCSM